MTPSLQSKLVHDMHLTWYDKYILDQAGELVKVAIVENADHKIAELDRNRPLRKEQRKEVESVNR